MRELRRAAVRRVAPAALLLCAALLSACAAPETRLTGEDLGRFRASGAVKSLRRVPPGFAVHSPWEATLPIAGAVSYVALPYVPQVASRMNLFEAAGEAAGEAGGPVLGVLSAEGAVAYATARRRGAPLVAPFLLEDPATILQESFAYTLRSTGPGMAGEVVPHGEALPAPVRPRFSLPRKGGDPAELAKLKAATGNVFLLDFRTDDWGLLYYTWDWDRYRVKYSATARLLDLTAAPRVAWEGRCEVLEDEYDRRPFLKDYLADNGALLRIRLLGAAEECSRQLWRKFAAAP